MAQLQNTSVTGSLFLSGSVTGPARLPHRHGVIYVKSDGKPYFSSSQVSESDLTATGGGGISFDGSTANGVLTYKDSDEATVESNLTFDGSIFKVSGSSTRLEVTGSDNSTLFGVHSTTNSNILTVTGSGRVGIGTATPSYTLDAEGDIRAKNNRVIATLFVWYDDSTKVI